MIYLFCMYRKLTNAKKTLIRKFFAKGMNAVEINKKVDTSYVTIRKYIRRDILKIQSKKRTYSVNSVELLQLIINDLTLLNNAEIIDKYNVTLSTITYLRNRYEKKGLTKYIRRLEDSFYTKLKNDTQIKADLQDNIPFNDVYLNYCDKTNSKVSYNTFYQTCKRLGFIVKIQHKMKSESKFSIT
jgi:transposase